MSKKPAAPRFTPEHPDLLPPLVRAYVDSLHIPTPRGRYAWAKRRMNPAGYAEACAYLRLGIYDYPDLRPSLCGLTPQEGERIQHRVNDLLAECRPDIPRADWRIVCRCGFPFYVAEADRPTEAYDPRLFCCPHCGQKFQVHLQPNGERLGCLYGDLVENAVTKALHSTVPSPAFGLPVVTEPEGGVAPSLP